MTKNGTPWIVESLNFGSATECVEFLITRQITTKVEGFAKPVVMTFSDPRLDLSMGASLVTQARWEKLIRDYIGDRGREFLKCRLKERTDTYSFTPENKNRHDRGDCFLGMVAATRPHRVTMFSRRCRLVPNGIMDLQILCCAVKALKVRYGVWYLNAMFCEKTSLYPILLELGWSESKIRQHLSPSDNRLLDGIQEGNGRRSSHKRVSRHLGNSDNTSMSTLEIG